MSTSLLWYGPKVMKQVEAQVSANLDRAAIYLVNDVVRSFGNPPKEPDSKGGFKKNSSKSWKRGHPSSPGDPPNVQTGTLRRSITWASPSALVRYVGSSLKGDPSYALCLEYGTGKMLARPYLRPALARCKATLFRIIAFGG